jgi:hypothetical protein
MQGVDTRASMDATRFNEMDAYAYGATAMIGISKPGADLSKGGSAPARPNSLEPGRVILGVTDSSQVDTFITAFSNLPVGFELVPAMGISAVLQVGFAVFIMYCGI